MDGSISIIIVDDAPIIRYGMVEFWMKQSEIRVRAEACTTAEALDAIREHRPDVVIVESSFLNDKRIEAFHQFAQKYGCKLLAYSYDRSWTSVKSFLDGGGSGYVLKTSPLQELTEAVGALSQGWTYVSPSLFPSVGPSDGVTTLTAREREIAVLVAQGYTNVEVAQMLCIGRRTVETHRQNLMRKLNINTRAELSDVIKESGIWM